MGGSRVVPPEQEFGFAVVVDADVFDTFGAGDLRPALLGSPPALVAPDNVAVVEDDLWVASSIDQ